MSAYGRAAAREHLTELIESNGQDPADFDVDSIVDYLEPLAVGPDLIRAVTPATLTALLAAHDRRVVFAAADLVDEVQTTPAELMRELVLQRITRRPDAMTDIVVQLARWAAQTPNTTATQ